ncbi:unnamed protein product [Dicrocoelium dendriticum]|nr:unnamed protein product [Dicrocoelium dendriticum]
MDLIFHENIPWDVITDQLPGCQCDTVCSQACPCIANSGATYTKDGRLLCYDGPLFECNSVCTCSGACSHRLVQHSLSSNIVPVYSVAERPIVGQCLIAARDLDVGEFICVYFGEVIPYEEACRREEQQLETFGRNYILIMQIFAGETLASRTCIDGDVEGPDSTKPVGRLVNHSCEPNLKVVPVHVDSAIPYAAMFTTKNIAVGAELTYDYADCVPGDKRQFSSVRCLCGSKRCHGYLPSVQ